MKLSEWAQQQVFLEADAWARETTSKMVTEVTASATEVVAFVQVSPQGQPRFTATVWVATAVGLMSLAFESDPSAYGDGTIGLKVEAWPSVRKTLGLDGVGQAGQPQPIRLSAGSVHIEVAADAARRDRPALLELYRECVKLATT
jgi:hypothetical protein